MWCANACDAFKEEPARLNMMSDANADRTVAPNVEMPKQPDIDDAKKLALQKAQQEQQQRVESEERARRQKEAEERMRGEQLRRQEMEENRVKQEEARRQEEMEAKRIEEVRLQHAKEETARLEQEKENTRKKDTISKWLKANGYTDDVNSIKEIKKMFGSRTSTPLIEAAELNNAEMVELLLWAGADPSKVNNKKLTPREVALKQDKKGSHKKVLALLARSATAAPQASNAANQEVVSPSA